ncbi:MAG: hypothetical protein E7566_06700 [Ruminococcaceae bacterium]|nr:hypothetical protein [Oscillospiraceae bacterium]
MLKKMLSILLIVLMIFSLSVPFVSAQEAELLSVSADVEDAKEYLEGLLDEAVKILQSPDINTYTPESCAVLEQAMGEAYSVYYNPSATAEQMNLQAKKLKSAIDNMKKKGVSENVAYYLSSAIVMAESKVSTELDYTPESYTVYYAALLEAKRMQTQAQSDEEAIAAAEALNTAVKNLVPVASNVSQARDYLRLVINKAYNTLDSDSNFTAESLQMLEAAIESANEVYYNTSATAQMLYYEADKLENTMNYMEEITISAQVREYLSGVISQADAKAFDEKDYTPESWGVYFDAYQEAKRVQSLGTCEEEFISAANTLGEAMTSLVKVDVLIIGAKNELLNTINTAHGILNSGEKYTKESVEGLELALDNANAVYVKEDATLQELQAENTKLQDSIKLLEKVIVSEEARNFLSDVISLARDEVSGEENYTPESWSVYIKAYLEAVRVLENGESDNEFINAANALGVAMESLVSADAERQVARAELLLLIEQGVPEGEFTSKSIKALESAIANATIVYENEDASIEEVLKAKETLEEAYRNLKEIVPIPEDKKKALAEVLSKSEKIVFSDHFDTEIWSEFTRVQTYAAEVLNSENSIEEEYVFAVIDLYDAMDELHKNAREKLYKIVRAGAPVGGNYTSESYKQLLDALDKARLVYDNINATTNEIVEQIDLVSEAIRGLTAPPVSSEAKQTLWNVIEKSQIDVGERADYTGESWSVYSDAYSDAMGTYYYGQSDSEYYLAAQKLQSAMESLVLLNDAPPVEPSPDEPTPDELYVTLGDVDKDGKVTIKDATFIQKCVAGLNNLEENGKFTADANRDGAVNIKDATEIQKHLAGLKACEDLGKDILVHIISE